MYSFIFVGFKLEFLLYSAPSTGVVVIIAICYFCKKYLEGRQARRRQEITNEENRNAPNEPEDIVIHYHIINDDDVHSNREIEENPYLEVIDGSSSSNSSSIKSRQQGYMQTTEASDVHTYSEGCNVHSDMEDKPTRCRNKDRKKNDDTDSSEQNNAEYLHPYNSLERGLEVDTCYEIPNTENS